MFDVSLRQKDKNINNYYKYFTIQTLLLRESRTKNTGLKNIFNNIDK